MSCKVNNIYKLAGLVGILSILLVGIGTPLIAAAETIELHGGAQFDESHPYSKAMMKFAELVQQYYQGPDTIEFVLHMNSELGLEKDYFGYMNQGITVDYAVISPSHMSTFSRMATIMDVPFLFRDVAHYTKCIEAGVFSEVEKDLEKRADVIMLGYGGGEKRHFFGRRPVRNMEELKGFSMRVQGSPIQTKVFSAVGAAPTVIAGSEVYNAIQTGVIEGAENSANAMNQLKWYEVGPEVSLSTVSITVRPLLFSGKMFRSLSEELQSAIMKAGAEAMEYERSLEIEGDDVLMQKLADEGKVTLHEFTERDKMLELAEPVKIEFAEEIGASAILDAINNVK